MVNFPLYDKLKSNKPTIKLDTMCTTIRKLPKENGEVIFALILHHAHQEGQTKARLPYAGKSYNGGGALYKADKLPEELRNIIACYVEMIIKE